MFDWVRLPVVASAHGAEVDLVILLVHVAMGIALIAWGVFFVIPLFRYRKSRQPRANYNGLGRNPIPYVMIVLLSASEMVLLIGFSLPLWDRQVKALDDDEDAFVVRVVAQQFAWNIHYPGPDGTFGRTDLSFVDGMLNPVGLDRDDPFEEDDVVVLNQLHLPVNRPVIIHLTTKDMIHSFSLPEFRIKQDVIPGMSIPVHFTPTMTTTEFRERTGDEDRDFEIACAQLCGMNHFTMRGFVVVETEAEFKEYEREQLELKKAYQDEEDWN